MCLDVATVTLSDVDFGIETGDLFELLGRMALVGLRLPFLLDDNGPLLLNIYREAKSTHKDSRNSILSPTHTQTAGKHWRDLKTKHSIKSISTKYKNGKETVKTTT